MAELVEVEVYKMEELGRGGKSSRTKKRVEVRSMGESGSAG